MAKFPKMPDLGIWKKDGLRLSRSGKDSIAPPSRTFDPEPSHFATQDAGRILPGDDRDSTMGQMASRDARPIREPYKIDSDSSASSDNSFGFPSNSKSLTGNNKQINMPDANDFRQAMNRASETTQDAISNARQSLGQSVQGAKDFAAGRLKTANDFVAGGGSFVARTSENAIAKTKELAQNTLGQGATQPKWKTDFELPKPEMKQPGGSSNQMANNDFQSSFNRGVSQAKNSVSDFNQKAMGQAANQFAQNASQSINQSLTKAAGQFERSWDDSVQQAKQTADALKSAQAFRNTRPVNSQSEFQGDFQPSNQQPTSPANSLAQGSSDFRTNSQGTTNPASRSVEVTPEVAYGNPKPRGTGSQPFASTGAGSFQPSATNSGNATGQGTPVSTTPSMQALSSPYPSTNYSAYSNQGPDRISKVTPIDQPTQPVLRAETRPDTSSQAAARTAGLPAELMRGNSNYAPGSVKPLSPIRTP